ncbi:hypothetical protein HNP83_006261 [Rhizobium leguminosarum]|nr:hypothetical protein [Rhizobium leguminosarum]
MFVAALKKSCLNSAKSLGTDIKKISWLMSNQSRIEYTDDQSKAA